EQDYFKRTGLFPIMHTVVIRRAIYERERWVAQSLYKALRESQRLAYEDLYETAALKTMLPWTTAHVEQTRRDMGDDFWPYGFERTEHALAPLLRYSDGRGLCKRRLAPRDRLAPASLEELRV